MSWQISEESILVEWLFGNKNFVGKVLDGRYQVIQELGSGGFGDTYLAKDMRSPNKLQRVIKHFKPKESPTSYMLQKLREKFEDEKKTLERLGEKNDQIPSLVDNFTWNNQFFYVQEFVDGHTLNDEIYDKEVDPRTHKVKFRPKTLFEAQVRSLLIDILEVMAFVHENKIIHRDLKPANIMRREDDQKIVIIDFGAVKQLHSITENSQARKSSVGIYTKGYAPAEQFNGNPFYASDVYAIGVIGIQALTGIHPTNIPKDTNLELVWRSTQPVTPEFLNVLQKMVRYDFKQRYLTAKESLKAMKSLPDLSNVQPLQQTFIYTTIIPNLVSPVINPPHPTPVTSPQNSSGKRNQSKPDKTSTYTAERSPNNPFKIIGGFLLVLLIGGGVYLWQNPKLLSSLRLPFLPNTPINDPKITISDTKAAALYVQAQEKFNKKDYKGAIADLNEVIRLVPDYTDAYITRGGAKLELGNNQEALSDYNKAIELKSDYAIAYYGRGFTKHKLGDTQGALPDYSKAIEIDRNWGSNISLADGYFVRGWLRLQLVDYQEALSDFNKAIEVKPDFAFAYYGLGIAKHGLGDKQGALSTYNKAVEINRNWGNGTTGIADVYVRRGGTKYELGDKQGAVSDYNKAIEIKTDYALAYNVLGSAKYNSGDKQGALADYSKAIEINRNWGDGTIGLAETYVSRAYLKNELGDKQGAIADYNEAIRLKPDNAETRYSRGRIKGESGDNQGAISDYNEASRIKPNYAYPYYGLGSIYKVLRDKTKALENFRKAAELLKQQNDTEWYRKALNEIAQLEK